jgi:hypothetical protein
VQGVFVFCWALLALRCVWLSCHRRTFQPLSLAPAPQLCPDTVRGMFWQGVFELEPHRANGHPKSQGWCLSIVLVGR